ncbi:MAG TPA: MJ0042-type zinc finger domain-containing protein [Gemmataceae bacterium]|nr:MJ0042-type zinc finger domain-containing protein [Gemmataceae bacterium]
MPEVILNCPQCQRQLRVTEELLGRPVKCPACGLVFTLPAGASPQQPAIPVLSQPTVSPPASEEDRGDPFTYPYDEHRRRVQGVEPLDFEGGDSDRGSSLLVAPAICLLVAGVLGILVNVGQVAFVLLNPREPPPANRPEPKNFAEQLQRALEEGQSGPKPVIIGLVFAVVSLFVTIGAVLMLNRRFYGLAIATSIVAMVNIGNCCCVLGLPFGIWCLVILARPEVKRLFH